MDKVTRNTIERATQQARKLLDEDFSSQLEGTFDVLRSGVIASKGGAHLSDLQQSQRDKIVAAIEHKRSAGMTAAEAVTDYVRDSAFTTLNRFVALKMLEARELVQECITRGEYSAGYREFCGMAPGVALLPEASGYRLYIESLFDEFSTEIKVLFDRRDAASVLWPKRQAFDALLAILNAQELSAIWGEDETIGWVYQFFNSAEERKKMRDESQAPRNSRELAVRNQFFTPRYVVQFLTDNTLGRLWLEMYGEKTRLNSICEYLVRPADEPIQSRPRKDPRDLRILDPACGSGHFLLYCFDLLLAIYEEAWSGEDTAPVSETTGRTLRADYPNLIDLRRETPRLIVEQNLYGVDIDPRCAQIAALALWLRAQRAWKDIGVAASERPRIRRTHIVVAEPIPGDTALVDEFAARLDPPLLRDLFKKMVHESRLAGELGALLRVEGGIAAELRRAREQFVTQRQTTGFLPGMESAPKQGALDLSGIDDDRFFHEAEARIVDALHGFSETAIGGASVRRRLFAGDAAQGVALIDLVRTRFDVVLMNPPFGLMPKNTYAYLVDNYPSAYYDLAVSFMARGITLLSDGGLCGAITTRAFMFVSDAERFRTEQALSSITMLIDLGSGVMDGAAVDASAQVMMRNAQLPLVVLDLRTSSDKASALTGAISSRQGIYELEREAFENFPGHRLAYEAVASLSHVFSNDGAGVEPIAAIARIGASTFDDERFLRARWEIVPLDLGSKWLPSSRTAEEFSMYYYPPLLTVKWDQDGREVCARNEQVNGQTAQARQGSTHYGYPGLVFARRSSPSIAFRAHPAGCAFASNTGVVLPREGINIQLLQSVLNSSAVRAAVNALSNRDSYTVGHIKKIRWPVFDLELERTLTEISRRVLQNKHWLYRIEETDPWFALREVFQAKQSCRGAYEQWLAEATSLKTTLVEDFECIDALVAQLFAIESLPALREQFGLSGNDILKPERLFEVSWADWVARSVSLALGAALGRWSIAEQQDVRHSQGAPPDPLTQVPVPRHAHLETSQQGSPILRDDPGHVLDVVGRIEDAWSSLWPRDEGLQGNQLAAALGKEVREWIASNLFDFHLRMYQAGKRTAPIYWQLAIPSGRFSVWLYLNALNNDTFFKLQTECVVPKLDHEERKLRELQAELGPSPTAIVRAQVTEQQSIVDDLRTFLAEVKRVAPLWSPNLDDGVLINFAPLWRLMPHHKGWQNELKATWYALCAGDYDWTHLAMHLWPERVAPKCATDRSLAIAHGLEDVFWAEADDGKWKPRPIPTRQVDEVVRERTSVAVKAALTSVLESPVANVNGGRGRGRRTATSASDGGAS